MEFGTLSSSYDINELYPNTLRFLFEKLYENGSPQLEKPILELFRGYNFEKSCNNLRVSKKISNYSELSCYITEISEYSPGTTWKVRALAELEAYLIQHGQQVDYSTK